MSRRKTQCLASFPTSGAPWSPWNTACGKVLEEQDPALQMDWPLEQTVRPTGVCRVCWARMRPIAEALNVLELSSGWAPQYTGPTFRTTLDTNPHRRRDGTR